MTEKKKAGNKLWVATLGSAALFALLVILATCSLFESKKDDIIRTDWKRILKNSTWTLSNKNISDSSELVPCLKSVSSVAISEDYYLTIRYGSYSFSAGKLFFNEMYNHSAIDISQATEKGYVENSLTMTFSEQGENYLMEMTVEGLGTFNFFLSNL